ncbi:MAG: hypothetical protein AAF357_14495 [Verrucomicrobiota bacterium]
MKNPLFYRLYLVPLIGFALSLVSCEEALDESREGAPSESESNHYATEQQPSAVSPEPSLTVDQVMRLRAQQQAAGLGGGGVKVNGAWNYRGFSYLSPDPNAAIEARLVAIDVTVSGHTANFDLDDIEIVDGASLMSYGSDPHATPLTLDGKLMVTGQQPEPLPKSSRWLLIYAFPKQSPAFHLYYWGKSLTLEALEFDENGLELPFPDVNE